MRRPRRCPPVTPCSGSGPILMSGTSSAPTRTPITPACEPTAAPRSDASPPGGKGGSRLGSGGVLQRADVLRRGNGRGSPVAHGSGDLLGQLRTHVPHRPDALDRGLHVAVC